MALIRYVSADTGKIYFAIVADDTQAEFVWPMEDDENAWFEGDERLEMLLQFEAEAPPASAADWIELASRHLGEVYFTDEETPDFKTGVKMSLRKMVDLSGPNATPDYTPAANSAAAAWDEVTKDYPDLGDVDAEGGDANPDATLHWVLQTLGPIDPEGPNGWIQRAADGNPRPGDENSFVHYDLPPYPEYQPTPEVKSE